MWVRAECEANAAEWDKISGMLRWDDVLIVNYFRRLTFHDLSNPRRLEQIGEYPLPARTTRIKRIQNELVVFCDTGIEWIDVSDPHSPERARLRQLEPEGQRRSGDVFNDQFVITQVNDIATLSHFAEPAIVATIPNDDFFKSYPNDVLAGDDHLFVVGRHAGLHVFNKNWEIIKSLKVGYTPTDLFWLVRNELMLAIGNDNVIVFDTSKPEKTKRLKAAKLKVFDLAGQLASAGDTIVTAGDGKNHKHLGAVVEFDERGVPSIQHQQVLEGHEPKSTGSDSVNGIVFCGGHLIISSFHARLSVYETPHVAGLTRVLWDEDGYSIVELDGGEFAFVSGVEEPVRAPLQDALAMVPDEYFERATARVRLSDTETGVGH